MTDKVTGEVCQFIENTLEKEVQKGKTHGIKIECKRMTVFIWKKSYEVRFKADPATAYYINETGGVIASHYVPYKYVDVFVMPLGGVQVLCISMRKDKTTISQVANLYLRCDEFEEVSKL